jgi:hypothetical protein
MLKKYRGMTADRSVGVPAGLPGDISELCFLIRLARGSEFNLLLPAQARKSLIGQSFVLNGEPAQFYFCIAANNRRPNI